MEATQTASAPGAHDRPAPDGHDIRLIRPDEIQAVADVLAEAFYDDPVMAWVFRDDAKRMRRLQDAFAFWTEHIWNPHGHCYAHERMAGASLWLPPNTWHLGLLAQLRLMPGMIATTRGSIVRLMRLLNLMESKHPHDDHYYLALVGVAPAWQGRGFGAALMRPVLERCDADGLPAYLEASTERNRALYERHGFEVVEEIHAPGGGPPLWRMWRQPRGA
jgi:GNAT superfamily N-acetyltransferase